MTRLSHRRQLTVAAGVVLVIASVAAALWLASIFRVRDGSIRQLQTIPVGARADLEGVVTYADPVEKLFWIQDDTGAVAIPENPDKYGLRVGQLVRVEATKTHAYDPSTGFGSVALKDVKVHSGKRNVKLPPPVAASLRTFPVREKTGIRVQVSGVVHQIARDELGRRQLAFGDLGQEGYATIPDSAANASRWLNTRVRIIGVGKSEIDRGGLPRIAHVLVAGSDDIQVEEAAPEAVPLFSVRGLYRDDNGKSGHLVRLRGWVVAHPAPTSVLVEDRWSAILCESDEAEKSTTGTAVEVAGYPVADGVLFDLGHCSAQPIPEREVEEAGRGENPTVLTTVAAIRRLSESAARTALPAKITAVITYNNPQWGQMMLQDSTGGMFVKYAESLGPLERGQLVTVTGVTGPGDYAPVLVGAKVVVQGKATWFPQPVHVTARDASSGILDSQYAEVEGVIHPFNPDGDFGRLTFELYTSFGQVHVYTSQLTQDQHFASFVDARVRIRGVFGTVFNSRRQLVGYEMQTSSADDIKVLEPATRADPYHQTAVPISDLLRFSPHADFAHRVRVQGSVTMIGSGFFYLQDESGGLQVMTNPSPVHLGDLVEVVGYASAGGGYSPVFSDATVRVVMPEAPVSPRLVTAESLSQGQYDSQLVTLDGRLLSVVDTLDGKSLVLQSGILTFNAQLDTSESAQPLPELLEGSILRLTGVCSVPVNSNKLYRLLEPGALEFKLLLPSPQDLRVLRRASWWTAFHSLAVAGVLSATILLVLTWVSMLRQRVRRQIAELRKAAAQAEAGCDLANAMREVAKREDFGARVSIHGHDEIGQLGNEFNRMLSKLEERDRGKKEAEGKLQLQALTDELTGLPNRRLLYDRLSQTLALAKRERNVVALVYIDLDGFKLVNDSLGHGVGDLLLCQVAVRLRSQIRQTDTLARLGGDEFTVVLATHASEEATLVAHKLLDVLAKQFLIEGHEITISASIGISFFPSNGADGGTLLQQADSAMYVAKRNGKNQVACFTSEMGSLVRERMNLENQLRSAIGRGEISVHYQPEFDVISHRLMRFEALARWTHATLGEISPSKFIPIAEESGLIIPLGAYIMERACAEAVKWQTMTPYPIQVAVNVSSLQFMRETFVEETVEMLRHTGLGPELLQIELTESVMLSGVNRAAETMKRLRAIGISLAIDDFGTGYSCLSYLPKLAFDALKIDRSFVSDLETRPETKALILSLVTLAHNLDMRVIVEGVETEEQMELIRKYGGNEVQGYLLGRPSADPEAQIRLSQHGTFDITVPDSEAVLPAPS